MQNNGVACIEFKLADLELKFAYAVDKFSRIRCRILFIWCPLNNVNYRSGRGNPFHPVFIDFLGVPEKKSGNSDSRTCFICPGVLFTLLTNPVPYSLITGCPSERGEP